MLASPPKSPPLAKPAGLNLMPTLQDTTTVFMSADATECSQCGGDYSILDGKPTCCDCGHIKGAVAPVDVPEERPIPVDPQVAFGAIPLNAPAGQVATRPLVVDQVDAQPEKPATEPPAKPQTASKRK